MPNQVLQQTGDAFFIFSLQQLGRATPCVAPAAELGVRLEDRLMPKIATLFVFLIPLATATSQEKTPPRDAWIPVLRHHPGIIDTKERMEARDKDEKLILETVKNQLGSYSYNGGLGRGYVLSIPNDDLPRWKTTIDKLLKAGSLKYYDRWGVDKNGYGLIPVPKN